MNAQKKKILAKITMLVSIALLGGNVVAPIKASANETAATPTTETIYYDDFIYQDGPYQGQGVHTEETITIQCDEIVVEDWAAQPDAPSYGNNDTSMTNICGPMAATNLIAYYDRWATNLIPNFDPGAMSYGEYTYFPDMEFPQVNAVTTSLYSLMQIASTGGTTSANFKSGLNTYVSNQGYSVTYTNCYNSATTLNMTTVKAAFNAQKVVLLMCSQYNFIYDVIDLTEEDTVYYDQYNSTVGHMMMAYGYKTLGYYLDGVKVGEDTFLLVSSGYSTHDQGYMRLNAFSVIDEAWVMYMG